MRATKYKMGCGVSQEASVKSLHSNIRWFDPEAPDAENRLDNIKAMKRFFNVRDPQNGNAAIHIAAQNGKAELVTYIINEGGLVDARNGTGQTAMHMATEYNMANVVRILKENNANVKLENNDGHAAETGIEGMKTPL